jgi:transposase-like protein
MARGRPIVGLDLLDGLAAPRTARRRVRLVLATLTGQLSIAEACSALGVRRTRFHALRQQVLRGALDAAAPRSRGRPRSRAVEAPEVLQLQHRIRELELALRTTQLRSEIALTMPFLLDRAGRGKKAARGQRASAPHSSRAGRPRRTARTSR